MRNSQRSQSEKLGTNRGRENAARTPRNEKVPGRHYTRDAGTRAAEAGAGASAPHRARARDRARSETTRRYACSADCRSRRLRWSYLCRVGLTPPATVGSQRVLTGSTLPLCHRAPLSSPTKSLSVPRRRFTLEAGFLRGRIPVVLASESPGNGGGKSHAGSSLASGCVADAGVNRPLVVFAPRSRILPELPPSSRRCGKCPHD
jgi:hypothetical protein